MTVAQTAVAMQPPRGQTAEMPPPGSDPAPPAILQEALRLEALGLSVIPLQPGSKLPARPWKARQSLRAGPALIRKWGRENPSGNFGIVTGRVSGLLVLDVDPGGEASLAGKHLPPTVTVKTPRGGFHYYYRLPPGATFPSRAGLLPGLDVRGEGGFVVAAGSRREDGAAWAWAIPPDAEDFADPPAWLVELLEAAAPDPCPLPDIPALELPPGELPPGVEEGRRNERAAQVIGRWISLGLPAEEVWARAQAWNQTNLPPLTREELGRVFQSIQQREAAKPAAARGVRIPLALLEAGRQGVVSWSAVVLAATWAGLRQAAPGRPKTAELAAFLGVTPRAVCKWRQELKAAGLWQIGEELPRRRFVPVRLDLLTDPGLRPPVKATGLVLARFVTGGQAKVGQEALASYRGLSRRQTVAEHLAALGGYVESDRARYDKDLPRRDGGTGRRSRCNVYTLRPGGTPRPFTGAAFCPPKGTRAHLQTAPAAALELECKGPKSEPERTFLKAVSKASSAGARRTPVGIPGAPAPALNREQPPETVLIPAAIRRVLPYPVALQLLERYTPAEILAALGAGEVTGYG